MFFFAVTIAGSWQTVDDSNKQEIRIFGREKDQFKVNHEILTSVAQNVTQSVESRDFNTHRPFNESLLSFLFCHELISKCPELPSRLWIDYRPWPEESDECIGCWIEGTENQRPIAIEIHVDDPANDSVMESARVWDQILSDVFRLATAILHRGLGSGYILLFGELRPDPEDERIQHFPTDVTGEVVVVKAQALQSATVMDAGFFEELLHPHEAIPFEIDIQLLECDGSRNVGFWLWKVGLPDQPD